MNNEKDMANIAWICLERALARFNESQDREGLLRPRCANPKTVSESAAAGERAITHRLAVYLELELRCKELVGKCSPIAVDCEYNRHESEHKSHAADAEDRIFDIVREARKNYLLPDDYGYYVFSVQPDIVVHQRGIDDDNLLVIEVKKRSNPETPEYDALKLELFTTPKNGDRGYGYHFGAWVIAEDIGDLGDRFLRIESRFAGGTKIA